MKAFVYFLFILSAFGLFALTRKPADIALNAPWDGDLFSSIVDSNSRMPAAIGISDKPLIRKIMSSNCGGIANECEFDWKSARAEFNCVGKSVKFLIPAKDAEKKRKALDDGLRNIDIRQADQIAKLSALDAAEPLEMNFQLKNKAFNKGLYVSQVSFVDPDLSKDIYLSRKLYEKNVEEAVVVEAPAAPKGFFSSIFSNGKKKKAEAEAEASAAAKLKAQQKQFFSSLMADTENYLNTGKYNMNIRFNESQEVLQMYGNESTGLTDASAEGLSFYQARQSHQIYPLVGKDADFNFLSQYFPTLTNDLDYCCSDTGHPACQKYFAPLRPASRPSPGSSQSGSR